MVISQNLMRLACLVLTLCLLAALLSVTLVQARRHKPTPRQTFFDPETPVEKPVALPKEVLKHKHKARND